jgi:hypothetical protein
MNARAQRRAVARTGVAAVAAAVVAGCGGGGSTPGGSAAAQLPTGTGVTASARATPSPSPSASASTTATAAAETDLADGRHPARIVGVDVTGRRVQVDVIQFFMGEAAAKAAAEDHAPEVPPPNDVWIRNASTRLRVLPIAPGAVVTVNTLAAEQTGSSTKDVPWTLAQLAGSDQLSGAVFWLSLDGGQVTRISQQYLP